MSNVPPSAASLRGAVDLSSLVNRAAAPAGSPAAGGPAAAPGAPGAAPGAGVAVPSLLLDGTDATFSQILDLSNAVPVIVELWASWSDGSRILAPLMQKLILEYGGQFVLVRVETDTNPQLAAAFQAQSVPTVAAIIAGRPVALFEGAQPEQSIRDVFDQVVQLAAQNGVTGRALPQDGRAGAEADSESPAEPVEEPLPPHHAEAFDAISQGDYKTAIAEYEKAIVQNPRDALAAAGLAQVKLLDRLDGKSLDEIRSAGAAAPDDIDAQLAVADLDVSGGHVEDAFDRILALFTKADQASKDLLRARMLELFEVVGLDDPRVTAARRRLTMLLY
ncbi:tetratricopeptide repeat protein [Subtercola endophyticus]|uniref:tetratricopeptide repeat protein n=1 Tax=Subtercola endophyticus TaxID=2895559 RepID=UPI001E4AE1A4|nr:tetratricopeptide repeat protein [Subtercola endophyticus]UFS60970.1 tetratricopeptide repeat protein [Subtercola endophyticus]